PGQGRRHLRPERDRAPALVLEVVELANDLLAALLDVELERLERRSVILLKTVATCRFPPRAHDVRANREILGIEIPKAWQTREGRHARESRRPVRERASARPRQERRSPPSPRAPARGDSSRRPRYGRSQSQGSPRRYPRPGRNPAPPPGQA